MDKYIGKRLDGRYEIKEIIGVGGMAYVYKAYDNIDDRIVAVKILKEEYLANDEFTRRFKNESKAIAILSHPNIVKVYDVSFGDRMQYIVMEYIDGITLKEYIDQQQDFKWKEAVHFTVQILRALQHAHDKGIVHRDIKPQNIMLLPDGTIKVTDFGIARFSRQDIRTTRATDKAIGSVHYISPEQARGEVTDEKADIYSVGVMLYEMLAGQLPFEAESAVSVAIMQLQSEAKPPREINPNIPEGLEDITVKAMQKDPSKRYQSAAEMLYDFDEFKKNPSIHFEYKYFVDESPTRYMETISRVKGEEAPSPSRHRHEEEDEEKKPFPVIPVVSAVAAAFVVVALVVVVMLFLNKFGGGGEKNNGNTITVPNFVGMTVEQIANNPEYLEWFKFNEYAYEYNAQPEGTVIDQSLEAGISVKKGVRDITLTVSRGTRMEPVPDVIGLHRDDAKAKLDNAGFKVTYRLEQSEDVEEGYLIALDPADTTLPYGSEVQMVVSNGDSPLEAVEVPDVTRLELKEAIEELQELGFLSDVELTEEGLAKFASTNVTYVFSEFPAGTVVSQTPADGEAMVDMTFTFEVSNGYQAMEIDVPLPLRSFSIDMKVYVSGQSFAAYDDIYPSAALSQPITVEQEKDLYMVTILVSKHGMDNFVKYAEYMVNAVEGTITQMSMEPEILSEYEPGASNTTTTVDSTTTTTTTEDTTTGTTGTNDPAIGTDEPAGTDDPTGDETPLE